ncbi:MAG: putative glycolipid-binding domain-containing protein [Solirubrobacteraceae bacterium]
MRASAAWRHVDVRAGFEVLFPRLERDGIRLEGHSTGVEEGEAWGVRYSIALDRGWVTRSAHVVAWSVAGRHEVRLEADGSGGWRVDGRPAPHLAGRPDVDLEASVCTNAIPVQRLRLDVGERADAPAAYVRVPGLEGEGADVRVPAPEVGERADARASGLAVERLEQTYARLEDDGPRRRYDYAAPRFDYAAVLVYDESGFVLDYPGLAVRVA